MKRSKWKSLKLNIAIITTAGMLFGNGNLGCASFFGNTGLSSFNFCFLFDCNNGALGGLLDFCSPINFTSFVGGADAGNDATDQSFLADCP